jgi:4,5-DOPA dioxygenase extradiol
MKSLPTMFVSHGAPPFALNPGKAGALLNEFGKTLRDVSAVLVISPHWMTTDLTVMTSKQPGTMYDFGGFDSKLQTLKYPATGHLHLATATAKLLESKGYRVLLDDQRAYDHGAWVPLLHLLPQADIPVFQLSMPQSLTPAQAYKLGQTLQPLSKMGVLIVGSGSMTHNLHEFRLTAQGEASYAKEFSYWVRDKVQRKNSTALVCALDEAPYARRAHPTDEHYLPLLIALGAAVSDAKLQIIDGGFTYSVLSMESYVWHPTQL